MIGYATTTTPTVYTCRSCGAPNLVLYPHSRQQAPQGGGLIVKADRVDDYSRKRTSFYAHGIEYYGPYKPTEPVTEPWVRGPYDALSGRHAYNRYPCIMRCGHPNLVTETITEAQAKLVTGSADQLGHLPIEGGTGYIMTEDRDGTKQVHMIRLCLHQWFWDRGYADLDPKHRDATLVAYTLGGEEAAVTLLRSLPKPWCAPPYVGGHVFNKATPPTPSAIVPGMWDPKVDR